MATHSSILAWKIPWKEEAGGLQFMKLQRVEHCWGQTHIGTLYIYAMYMCIYIYNVNIFIYKSLHIQFYILHKFVCVYIKSHVWLFMTPWTVAYHTPPSMGFSRQEYWSGLPFPSPGDLPDPGIEPVSPTL